jgi:hypothetical protein
MNLRCFSDLAGIVSILSPTLSPGESSMTRASPRG